MEALQPQVAERKLREETEKCREEAFDVVHLQGAQVAQILEVKKQEQAWGLCQALEATWAQQQAQDQAAELEDQGPPGPASLQCFKGEDPEVVVRRQEQQNEQHRVLDQQRETQNQAQAERDSISDW
ncbi:RIB43A-like with coiled-coils protein 1 [Alligator sinensis]|uniref:RIB43A-like with coiled-coils protein 1 n=1 Tax=Alligator sinensis TaxID=38654 RepID=A0A3Q0HG01_ALLSI|nr:RIB43A-like with coiled-coils protein 1 [Alligator sinensis]